MMSQANHVPLSPLSFLARARRAFGDKVAVVDADGKVQKHVLRAMARDRPAAGG